MEEVLQCFSGYSGQKVNISKSKLFVSKNMSCTLAQAISSKWV